MNFNLGLTLPYFCAVLLLAVSCSTEPEVNWDKLEKYTYVACELVTYPQITESGAEIYQQRANLHSLIPITGLVFDPPAASTDTITDKDNFTIVDASVSVYDDSTHYHFHYDSDIEAYIWEGDEQFVFPGHHYELNVELEDGHTLHSETTVPDLQFEENSDTIWVWPDSVTSWYSDRRQPLAMTGEHYVHTIPLRITPGTFISRPSSEIGLGLYDDIVMQGLWYKIEKDDSSIVISTAADSLNKVLSNFIPVERTIGIMIEQPAQGYRETGDDNWPIMNLERTSNIEGGYGYFYGEAYSIYREFTFALLPSPPQ